MKKNVIVTVFSTLLALGGTLSLEAAGPTPPAKPAATASAAPAKAAHSKKSVHHVKHAKKHGTQSRASNRAS